MLNEIKDNRSLMRGRRALECCRVCGSREVHSSAYGRPTQKCIDYQRNLISKLRSEAEIHAQEARTANSTIHEIYQLVSGATGEPGTWNGARPVREMLERLGLSSPAKTTTDTTTADGETE